MKSMLLRCEVLLFLTFFLVHGKCIGADSENPRDFHDPIINHARKVPILFASNFSKKVVGVK